MMIEPSLFSALPGRGICSDPISRPTGPNFVEDLVDPAYRHAVNPEVGPAAIIGLYQRPNRVELAGDFDQSRGGPRAALKVVTDHACSPAGVALSYRPGTGVGQRSANMLGRDMEGARIIQETVVRLAHYR